MARRRLAVVVSLALMAAGGLVAHELAYRIVAPGTGHHHATPAADPHGYLAYLPLCIAVCGAIAIVAVGALAFMHLRSHVPIAPPLWLFGIVPPFGFAIQEHLERLVATGSLPYSAALETTFVVGMILQLPFAVVAYLAARALIALVVAVVKRYGGARRLRRTREPAVPREGWLPVFPAVALASGHGERAPPHTPL